MEITKEWLKKKSACKDGYEWSIKNLKDKPMPENTFIEKLIEDGKYQWASWVLVRVFDKPNNVRYAIFSAEQVIGVYEKKYPNNDNPRKAIEASKKWLNDPTKENRVAAADAYADAAADAAAAYAAAVAAAAADADAAATYAAAAAAYAAAAAAADADAAAAYAAAAARTKMRIKILKYGLSLLKGK